jgi:hypothetical protein
MESGAAFVAADRGWRPPPPDDILHLEVTVVP